jgi:hypothetical protein
MPKRPPKGWFTRCVRGVRRSGAADNPAAVCGAEWRDKSPAQKRAATRKAEGKMTKTKHCRSVTKSGKPSKHGKYRQCKKGGHWGPIRKKHQKK